MTSLASIQPSSAPVSTTVSLGNVCSLRTESIDPKDYPTLPYVGLEHIGSGSPKLARFGDSSAVASTKFRFYAGDVLYGKLRPYLDKAVLAEIDGICSTDILVLRPTSALCSGFLAYFAHTFSFLEHAISSTKGVNHPRTSWSSLAQFRFALPSIAVQREIERILDGIQLAIHAHQRELALERKRKAALMHHLFTCGTRGEPTKQTEIGEMPESWLIVQLGDIAEITYGLTVNEARRNSPDTAPYLTVANITRGALKLDEVKFIGMLRGDADNYRVRAGDVLFVEGSGNPRLLGSAAIWNDELPFALHQNHLIRARPEKADVLPVWIMSYFNSDAGRNQIFGKATTSSGLHNINSRLIASLRLPLPEMAEQRDIAGVYDACDAYIGALERETAICEELFKVMLDDLMTNRLPVSGLSGHSTPGPN